MTRTVFKALLEELFRVPQGSLKESDSRETLENWSSLVDVEILTIISAELGIDAELLEYETVGELLDLLAEQQAFTV
jgi:acyl carrier protein